jgi:hypothetical protein
MLLPRERKNGSLEEDKHWHATEVGRVRDTVRVWVGHMDWSLTGLRAIVH